MIYLSTSTPPEPLGDGPISDDRWQPVREELARYPELPRFTLSRATVQGMVDELARLDAAGSKLAAAEAELAKYRANPLWNIRAAPEPPWCDTCEEYTDHETSQHAAYDRALSTTPEEPE